MSKSTIPTVQRAFYLHDKVVKEFDKDALTEVKQIVSSKPTPRNSNESVALSTLRDAVETMQRRESAIASFDEIVMLNL